MHWYCSEPRLSLNKTVVTRLRIHLEERHLAPSTINGVSLANGKPVVLVGHSIGGMINLTFCRLYPDLVNGLICCRVGIEEAESGREIAELSDVTAVENLAHELHEQPSGQLK